jgi:hypothetical protein
MGNTAISYSRKRDLPPEPRIGPLAGETSISRKQPQTRETHGKEGVSGSSPEEGLQADAPSRGYGETPRVRVPSLMAVSLPWV